MTKLTYNLDLFDASLIVSTLSCGLVTGFILTYAIIVMPGLSKLTDRNFLRAFQVTDEKQDYIAALKAVNERLKQA